MGLDLDLAVSHPESDFSPEYKHGFQTKLERTQITLQTLGLNLPSARPLPRRFPFRISMGSYGSVSAFSHHLDRFVDHLVRYHTLPWIIPAETTDVESHLPAVLGPCRWKTHLMFGIGQLFVPVKFDHPMQVALDPVNFHVCSSQRALALVNLLVDLTHLNENNFWGYADLLPAHDDDPFRGYTFVVQKKPSFPELWALSALRQALQYSVEFLVCVAVS